MLDKSLNFACSQRKLPSFSHLEDNWFWFKKCRAGFLTVNDIQVKAGTSKGLQRWTKGSPIKLPPPPSPWEQGCLLVAVGLLAWGKRLGNIHGVTKWDKFLGNAILKDLQLGPGLWWTTASTLDGYTQPQLKLELSRMLCICPSIHCFILGVGGRGRLSFCYTTSEARLAL